jgi:predicted membrane metal-binding protein
LNQSLILQCQFGTVISLIFFLTRTRVWLDDRIFQSGPDLCQTWMPKTDLHSLYDALICGTALSASREKQIFVDTGLIHLMVVSGSHLVFLELLLGFLPARIRLAILAAYCYLTGFQAPVVRAFLRRLIGPKLSEWWALTGLQTEAAAVMLALAIYPQWFWSRSFLMSWMCGLALAAPKIFPRFPNFDLAVKAYLFLLPFCAASPVSIAWNTLLAPFVGLILFPACILSIALPPFVVVSDWMWSAFIGILQIGPHGMQAGLLFRAQDLCWIPVLVHLLLLVMEVRWRRASAFSYSPSF